MLLLMQSILSRSLLKCVDQLFGFEPFNYQMDVLDDVTVPQYWLAADRSPGLES